MQYLFDHAKQAANVAKHGVFFSAAAAFEWENAIVEVDSRHAYGEPHLTAIAPIGERVHVMVFTLRETHVHIISLRKANSREVRRYANHC
ncbi:MAG: hypothetical protein GAK30_01138 [Paracidovorax wautersii]|uniref:Uncharacterized protein n=1 Tax=Paracidovorax wautersii TaxID=1177982 RepID=A0A7V8FQC5_9BURK|nr:MAG: hypothetical protein GAK30_01138 [Paracidovorax wautersii]